MAEAFTSKDDPRFDGYVMALARKQVERDFHFGLGQLAVGSASAVLFIFWTIRHYDELYLLPALGLFFSLSILLRTGRSTLQRARNVDADLPTSLTRDEKHQVRDALYAARFNPRQTTPGTIEMRRKIRILLLCRLLVVVAILALIVTTAAINQANGAAQAEQTKADSPYVERTFTDHDPNLRRYTYAEFWLRQDDGQWYGIGP